MRLSEAGKAVKAAKGLEALLNQHPICFSLSPHSLLLLTVLGVDYGCYGGPQGLDFHYGLRRPPVTKA